MINSKKEQEQREEEMEAAAERGWAIFTTRPSRKAIEKEPEKGGTFSGFYSRTGDSFFFHLTAPPGAGVSLRAP